jgi:hypothetical protein
VGGLLGAAIGGALLSLGMAWLLTAIYGGFEGSAAMGGFAIGLPLRGPAVQAFQMERH